MTNLEVCSRMGKRTLVYNFQHIFEKLILLPVSGLLALSQSSSNSTTTPFHGHLKVCSRDSDSRRVAGSPSLTTHAMVYPFPSLYSMAKQGPRGFSRSPVLSSKAMGLPFLLCSYWEHVNTIIVLSIFHHLSRFWPLDSLIFFLKGQTTLDYFYSM